jgi:hypothetical protein
MEEGLPPGARAPLLKSASDDEVRGPSKITFCAQTYLKALTLVQLFDLFNSWHLSRA